MQPLLERILQYLGLHAALNYASTCRSRALERKWLIEHCALVDLKHIEAFSERHVYLNNVSVIFDSVQNLQQVFWTLKCREQSVNLTHLTSVDVFNQPLDDVTFPPTLKHLTFGVAFDQPLQNVSLPPALTHLTLGNCFNQPLGTPVSTKLKFAYCFDQPNPLDHVTLPSALNYLTFGEKFNQPLDNVTLPTSLTHLLFGKDFNQPLGNVTLPPRMTHLTFGLWFDQPLDKVALPPKLTYLTVHCTYRHTLDCLPSRVCLQRVK